MLKIILLVLFYLVMPAVVLRICHVSKLINKIGAVLLCYVVGLILSQTGLMDTDLKNIASAIATICVPLALPMLLFSSDLKAFYKMGGKAFLSMLSALVGLTIVIITGYYIFNDKLEEGWKISGMLFGLNSGGTPNVAAIKTALNADEATYIYINTFDTVLSGAYMLFMISIAKPFFLLFLKDYPHKKTEIDIQEEQKLGFKEWISQISLLNILKALGMSVIIAAIAVGAGFFFKDDAQMTVIILLITTLGIAVSFIPSVKGIKNSYDTGMYVILVFSIAVASLADFSQFQNSSIYLFLYMAYVISLTFIFHIVCCKILKVDTDTLMVTSTALICSPPFVPVVAAAIKNREVMISGITVGIIGYIIGNYLGITIAYLLK